MAQDKSRHHPPPHMRLLRRALYERVPASGSVELSDLVRADDRDGHAQLNAMVMANNVTIVTTAVSTLVSRGPRPLPEWIV